MASLNQKVDVTLLMFFNVSEHGSDLLALGSGLWDLSSGSVPSLWALDSGLSGSGLWALGSPALGSGLWVLGSPALGSGLWALRLSGSGLSSSGSRLWALGSGHLALESGLRARGSGPWILGSGSGFGSDVEP